MECPNCRYREMEVRADEYICPNCNYERDKDVLESETRS